MNPRPNHRRAGRAPSLAVVFAATVWGAACSDTSIDVLTARDAAGGGTDDGDVTADASADVTVDASADVTVDASADVRADASADVRFEASLTDVGDAALEARPPGDVGDVALDAGTVGDGGVGCRALDAACSYAGACCSLSCTLVSPPSLDRKCTAGPLCTPAGGPCADNADCCANRCESNVCLGVTPGTCLPAGEPCSSASECCSARCSAVDGGGTRCTVSTSCRPRGETCGEQQDCCSGLCAPDSRGVQICVDADAATATPSVGPSLTSSCGTETE